MTRLTFEISIRSEAPTINLVYSAMPDQLWDIPASSHYTSMRLQTVKGQDHVYKGHVKGHNPQACVWFCINDTCFFALPTRGHFKMVIDHHPTLITFEVTYTRREIKVHKLETLLTQSQSNSALVFDDSMLPPSGWKVFTAPTTIESVEPQNPVSVQWLEPLLPTSYYYVVGLTYKDLPITSYVLHPEYSAKFRAVSPPTPQKPSLVYIYVLVCLFLIMVVSQYISWWVAFICIVCMIIFYKILSGLK